MLKTDYNIPIFEDTDAADLNKYSNEMAKALKTQINNTNNEIKEIDQKVVDAVAKFTEPLSYKGEVSTKQDLPTTATNGDIYSVTSENKNYIYNGTNWVEYSSILNLTPLENNTKTTKTTEISEDLTVEDASPVNGKLDISGKTKQATRSGKNILPISSISAKTVNGVTFTPIYNSDGSLNYINVNGTATNNINYTVWNNKLSEMKLNKNYILTGCPSGGSNSGYRQLFWNNSTGGGDDTGNGKTLKCTDLSHTYYIRIDISSGTVCNNLHFKPMIRLEGTDNTYEPYGISPSPDYPSPIRNVGDNINLIDARYGIDIKGNDQYTINVIPNTQYTLNLKQVCIALGTVTRSQHWIKYYDKTDTLIKQGSILPFDFTSVGQILNGTTTFETPENCTYIILDLGSYNGTPNTIQNLKAKLEEGSIPTGYSPYGCGSIDLKVENEDKTQSKIITFPLSKGQLLHQGDYLAEDGIHQKRKTLVLNGTEDIFPVTNTEAYNRYTLKNTGINVDSKYANDVIVISSHFKGETFNNRGTSIDSVFGSSNGSATSEIYFNVDINRGLTSVSEFKTFLSTQYANGTPVMVEYLLAKEIVIPYTEEQKEVYYQLQHLQMYEGYNYITCIDEIKPDMQLTYYFNNEINKTYGTRFDENERKINELEKSEIYSTEEQVIGKWIDGKPLYRKILSLNTPSTTNNTIIGSYDETFIVKKYYGYVDVIASSQLIPINFYFSNEYSIATYIVRGTKKINMKVGNSSYASQPVTIILEYTKTTD